MRILCYADMRACELVFVLASAWVGAVVFCTAVRVLCGCAPAGHVYIPVKHFPALEAKMRVETMMRVEKTQLLM